jgi:hypothetical protein
MTFQGHAAFKGHDVSGRNSFQERSFRALDVSGPYFRACERFKGATFQDAAFSGPAISGRNVQGWHFKGASVSGRNVSGPARRFRAGVSGPRAFSRDAAFQGLPSVFSGRGVSRVPAFQGRNVQGHATAFQGQRFRALTFQGPDFALGRGKGP